MYTPLTEVSEEVRNYITNLPLDTPTAILYQAYYKTLLKGYNRSKDDNYMKEIPWYLINWTDVALFCPSSINTFNSWYDHSAMGKLVKIEKDIQRESNKMIVITYENERLNIVKQIENMIRKDDIPLELSFMLSDVQLLTKYYPFNTIMGVVSTVNKKGEISVHIPRVNEFMNRLGLYLIKKEYISENLVEDNTGYGLYQLIAETEIPRYIARIKTKLTDKFYASMYYVNLALFCQSRTQRFADSAEFPDVCRRIADTLGTNMLEGYAKFLAEIIKERDKYSIKGIAETRIRLFVEAAINVIETVDTTNFTQWPIVPD